MTYPSNYGTKRTRNSIANMENRSKYFNLGYVKQSLVFKDFGDEKLKNDFGVSISWGKTYFTCTKNRCSEC